MPHVSRLSILCQTALKNKPCWFIFRRPKVCQRPLTSSCICGLWSGPWNSTLPKVWPHRVGQRRLVWPRNILGFTLFSRVIHLFVFLDGLSCCKLDPASKVKFTLIKLPVARPSDSLHTHKSIEQYSRERQNYFDYIKKG